MRRLSSFCCVKIEGNFHGELKICLAIFHKIPFSSHPSNPAQQNVKLNYNFDTRKFKNVFVDFGSICVFEFLLGMHAKVSLATE